MNKFECLYCGEEFELSTWVSVLQCPHCKDKNLRQLKEFSIKKDIFGYDIEKPKQK